MTKVKLMRLKVIADKLTRASKGKYDGQIQEIRDWASILVRELDRPEKTKAWRRIFKKREGE
jgi:hypothetical protein